MIYSLHPGAEQDITYALDFYNEHAGPVVAERFLEEFERIAKLLVKHPGLGIPTTRGRRTFPLKIFPYSVIYRNLESSIRILIVRHQHRKPGYAGDRR
ncbi:type II toxin-antitoxin system RelE/ParE family toxin [Candidatus Nitrotoga sp. HW29]|uniref:type II toxin-antitoxin system RelE/ParE family toxin n=1 Tax=Candidatus Nitrotoga sp. HW29 TaxID=2886963 RepID=UPI001EF194F1|nr:type II toxin-antitoxin system RelE/ParE family toxin [Candidatus Nitrotoga sp. HW29]